MNGNTNARVNPITPLRSVRTQRGETLRDVCAQVGLPISSLSRIERLLQRATPESASRLARYYQYAVNEVQILYPERFMPTQGRQSRPLAVLRAKRR
jgi:transcriptional regulator with XRE-family HTH domain